MYGVTPETFVHSVPPSHMHGKLMFYLCRTCASTLFSDESQHTDEERMFTGTYVADKLLKAVSVDYSIAEYHEI